MFRTPRRVFFWLIVLILVLAMIDLPENKRVTFTVLGKTFDRIVNPPNFSFNLFGLTIQKQIRTSLGLDLAGGSHVVLEADMNAIPAADRMAALDSAKEVIERRVNFFGVVASRLVHASSPSP